MRNEIVLDGKQLTVSDLLRVTREGYTVAISEESKEKIKNARKVIEDQINQGHTIYGVSTGFGKLANTLISAGEQNVLQENIIRSHSIGFGPLLPDEIVLGAMVIAVNSYCKGCSGIRLSTVEMYIELINNRVIPLVPSIGSLGASGDLAPLAYIASVLMGEGKAKLGDEILPGKEILSRLGLTPLKPVAKEGLSLVNGTHILTSFAAHTIYDAYVVLKNSSIAVGLTLEAFHGNLDAFSYFIMNQREHRGQHDIACSILKLTEGSELLASKAPRVQDPYSLRCSPQVHGAVLDTIRYAQKVVETELNSATDNPLISVELNKALSGGNFHGEPIALVMDFLAIALTELGTISERRVNQLLNTALSNLPPFLSKNAGLNSGLMILQYSDAAISAENKVLASPASIDNTPVSADQEDHVSMGLTSSKKAYQIVRNVVKMVGIEIYSACQALIFKEDKKISPHLEKVYEYIREKIPPLEDDRRYDEEVYWLIEEIMNGKLVSLVEEKLSDLDGEN
ncbi:MAG: histidine ammonia-lyase [Candidatus Heimdallarchaeaceae archaeon]